MNKNLLLMVEKGTQHTQTKFMQQQPMFIDVHLLL